MAESLLQDTGVRKIALTAAAAIAASAAIGALVYQGVLETQTEDFQKSGTRTLAVAAETKARALDEFHRERLSDLTFFSANGAVAGNLDDEYAAAFRGDSDAARRLREILAELVVRGSYDGAWILDPRGRVIASVGRASPRPLAAPGAPRLADTRRLDDGRLCLTYAARTAHGGTLALLHSRGPWSESPAVGHLEMGRSVELAIYQARPEGLELIGGSHRAPDRVIVPYDSPVIAARAHRGERDLTGPDYQGVPCRASAGRSEVSDWLVIAKIPVRELMAPLRRAALLAALGTVGAFGLLSAAGLLLWRAREDDLVARAHADQRLLTAAIEQAGESVVITDAESRILYANPAFEKASGYSRAEALGRNPSILKSGRHPAEFYEEMWRTLRAGAAWTGRLVNRRKDGTLYEEDATIAPVRDPQGRVTHYIAVKRDVSAVKSLEDQLYHAQKMEAIGRLAGGIAHDFNNILTTINGYAEMLADAAPPESQLALDLSEILGAGRRAALLTRQLLAFSRRAPNDPVALELRAHIRGVERIIRRTIGEDLKLQLDLPREPLWIRGDPGQLDQIVLNLAVNARDAMPQGGTLRLGLHGQEFARDEIRLLEVIPAGRYAVLAVSDDGVGMDGATLSRIFEPFFTTKEKGKGTGLGLATVFGIVKQNHGHITVDSAPGRGSTFTIYLPLAPAPDGAAADPAAPASEAASARGDEFLVVVEDQEQVLRLATRALTASGYSVRPFASPQEALRLLRDPKARVDLLLTDVVMPEMSGAELAKRAAAARPGLRVLFMSGYTDGRLETGEGEPVPNLLLKPFTAHQLAARVRAALDAPAEPPV